MLVGIQVIGVLFGLGLLYITFTNYKRKAFGKQEYFFWSVAWLLFISITLFPDSLTFILKPLAIIRVFDLMTILALMFLVAVTFHNYLVVKKSHNKVERLVRNLALKKK